MMLDDQFTQAYKYKEYEAKNELIGAFSYDLLANPLYSDAFAYVSHDISEEEQKILITDGDDDENNDGI